MRVYFWNASLQWGLLMRYEWNLKFRAYVQKAISGFTEGPNKISQHFCLILNIHIQTYKLTPEIMLDINSG